MLIKQFPDVDSFKKLIDSYSVVPCYRVVLNDLESPVSILGKIFQRDGAFLFESVEGGERWGRYSFLGMNPYMQVYVFQENVRVLDEHGRAEVISHNGEPLEVLRRLLSRFSVPDVPGLPRFWGGFVGYFCYEFVSFFEPVPNLLPDDAPLATFVVPRDVLIFDHKTHEVILLSMVFKNTEISPSFDEVIDRLDTLESLLGTPLEYSFSHSSVPHSDIVLTSPISPDDFRKKVLEAKKHIVDGDVIQIVLSQPFQASAEVNPWFLYRLQRYINPSPYMFYFNLGGKVLVGSSPETMVRLEHGTVSLRPIAGTRPRGSTEQEDRRFADELLKDEKERAEHVMLVDLGRNDLGRVAQTGTVQVTEYMTVERYSHVMHLVSHVQASLRKELDAWDVLRATFPAGTLTGAPKVRAMQIIAELEGRARGPYGGAIGYISYQGNMDLAITIRTAEIEKGQITIQAGAGIVFDSDPEKERLETIHKARALEQAIKLLDRMERRRHDSVN